MKKNAIKIISCAFACAMLFFSAPSSFFGNKASVMTTSAESRITNPSEIQLISPSSYEQYLPLTDTQDVAKGKTFTAIADDKIIYIYDQSADLYRVYTHDRTVTKLQFDERDELYFLDNSTYLYKLDPVRLEPTKTTLVCSNFFIAENTLYFTNTLRGSTVRKTSLTALDDTNAITLLDDVTPSPSFAFEKNELYYTDGKILKKVNPSLPEKSTTVAIFPNNLLSITVSNNLLTCATSKGTFFAYDLLKFNEINNAEEVTPLFTMEGNFSALSLFERSVYAVNGNAVLQYSLDKEKFEDFEITSSSSSISRLQDAATLCLSDEYLFIADNGNERISVYNVKEKSYLSPITTTLQPTYLATNGDTLLATNGTNIQLFDLAKKSYGELLFESKSFNGNAVGATAVFGKYYLVTDKNQFLSLVKENGKWERLQAVQKTSTRYPSLLTSDAYGSLYVRCNDALYRYTEENFLSAETSDEELFSTLPEHTKSLTFDYRGNLYALVNTEVYQYALKNGKYEQTKTFDFSANPVCSASTTATPIAFALSMTENAAYLLDENDYLVKRTDLQLPTLKNIYVNGVDEQILQGEYANFDIVSVEKDALMVRFDFNKLQGATYFPYVDYKRSDDATTGIKLASIDVYDVLAVYDNAKKRYDTYLVYSNACASKPKDEHHIVYVETEQKTNYLTNDVGLYKLPFLSSPFAVTTMKRGMQVRLLGEVNGLHLDYYYVEYEYAGEKKKGYVAKAYVTDIRTETPSENPKQENSPADKGSVGRLVYLLLGLGVIGILTDYLILKEKKEHKDE